MPIISQSTNRQHLIINTNHLKQTHTQDGILKKIKYVSQQQNTLHSSTSEKKHTAEFLITNSENINKVENTNGHSFKNIIIFIIGIIITFSGIVIFRKVINASQNKISDLNNNQHAIPSSNVTYFIKNEARIENSSITKEYRSYKHKKKHSTYNSKTANMNTNHPYKYYYTEEQQTVCSDENLLDRCKTLHIKKKHIGKFTKLILKSGKINCYCPPPENQNVEIIHPKFYPTKYYYTEKQEEKCKTKKILENCKKIHNKKNNDGVYLNSLVLNSGKTNCYCPPPEGHNIKIIEPKIQKQIVQQELITIKQKKMLLSPEVPATVKKTEEHDIDDVVKQKIFDDSCVDDSQNIDIKKVLRLIGNALAEPVTQMAIQSKKYYDFNILMIGCPSAQVQDKIKNVTHVVDQITSNLLQISPGSIHTVLLQNIISPLLIILSDQLDDKDTDFDLVEKIHQNSLYFSQDLIRTLTINNYASNNKPNKSIKKKKEDENIIVHKDNKLGILIDNNFHELNHHSDGTPYIKEKDNSYLIGYNKDLKKWMTLSDGEEIIYSIDNKKNINDYGVSPDSIQGNIIADKTIESEYISVQQNGNKPRRYILTSGKLIEVKSILIDGKEVTVTASSILPKKIILKNRFDWFFEKKSTSMSEPLQSFINNEITGEEFTDHNPFTIIEKNGICFNSEKQEHLKYEDKYYPIYLKNINLKKYFMYTKYNEEVSISKKPSEFEFQWNTAIQAGINTELCGITDAPSIYDYKISIDEDAYTFLISHGETKNINTENLKEVFKGTYLDTTSNEHVFVVQDNAFVVSKYIESENLIFIKSDSYADDQDDIQLYVFNDLIIRKRMREINEEYIQIKNCVSKRDLMIDSCTPILISKNLKETLDRVVKNSAHININDEGIVRHDDIPGCFKKNNKLYFYHEGFMFKAKESYLKNENGESNIQSIDLFISTLIKKINTSHLSSRREKTTGLN